MIAYCLKVSLSYLHIPLPSSSGIFGEGQPYRWLKCPKQGHEMHLKFVITVFISHSSCSLFPDRSIASSREIASDSSSSSSF